MKPARVLVADPPWAFGDSLPGKTRGAVRHYPCMGVYDLMAFELPKLADDCLLFLWRVSAMQEEALRVCRAWGFEPKAELIWCKTTKAPWQQDDPGLYPPARIHFGMGRYVRQSHETCLIGRRGKAKVRDRSIRSLFFAPVGEHSRKPDEFYQLVETLAEGPYAELFARRKRRGWRCYGNEIGSPGIQRSLTT